MIIEKHGNIFDSMCSTIVIPVNRIGVMGKGLALEAKKKYPKTFKEYRALCLQQEFDCLSLHQEWDDRRLLCLATKDHWREDSDIELIRKSLLRLINHRQISIIKSIAFPKIGCGLGNLDWNKIVYPLMKEILEDYPYDIEVYI
jgi:O-acetyl-ADP-ribose deacetylase (regulator of RNase III)